MSSTRDGLPRYRTIVCATDFSDSAELAVDLGADLARRAGSRLLLAHVVEAPAVDLEPFEVAFDYQGYRENLTAEYSRRLDELAAARRDDGIDVDTRLGHGSSGPEIVRIAEEERAGLLVLGATGHSGLDRVVFGSTPESVIPHSPCPVLSARVATDGFQHVLVSTDFSASAEQAFPHAVAFADLHDARLTLLHVATVYPADPMAPEINDDGRAQIEAAARERLEDVELPGDATPTSRAVIRALSAKDGILRFAENHDVDLIVTATHGHTGLSNVLLGSTAAGVARHASTDVLTVRCQATA